MSNVGLENTAPVNGVWRLENADYNGHRLTVYRSKAPGAYRAYVDGRMIELWKSKEASKQAAEKAALARTTEDHKRGEAPSTSEAAET